MLRRYPSNPGQPTARPATARGGLGPKGQGVFERLFGGGRATPAQSAVREAPTIAIASGKGGTGKSFLSTSLGVLFAQRTLRSLIVDCDFGLACDHLLLGVKPELNLQHLLSRRSTVREVLVQTPFGPSLLPGSAGVRSMARLTDTETQRLGESLSECAADHDVVLLDIGAGLSPQNVLTCCAADFLVLVTQPEIAALTDAYAVIKTLASLNAARRIGIVVNRVLDDAHGPATFAKLRDVAARHTGLELIDLGAIPDDPLVTQRRLGQAPLCVSEPSSPTVENLRAVADKLAARVGPLRPRERAPGDSLAARFSEFQSIV